MKQLDWSVARQMIVIDALFLANVGLAVKAKSYPEWHTNCDFWFTKKSEHVILLRMNLACLGLG